MNFRITPVLTGLALVLSASLLMPVSLSAHSESKHDKDSEKVDYSKAEEHEFGRAADPKLAARTVVVQMSDQMRFSPDVIEVKRAVGDRLMLTARAGYVEEDYRNIARKDERIYANIGAHYRLTDNIGIIARAGLRDQSGGAFGRSYDGHSVSVGVRFVL